MSRSPLDLIREERQRIEFGYRSYYTTESQHQILDERLRVLKWVEELLEAEGNEDMRGLSSRRYEHHLFPGRSSPPGSHRRVSSY